MRSHTWMSPVASHHRTHHFLETPTRSCCGLSSERADFSKEDEQRKAHKCSSFIPCPAWVNRPNSESLDPFSFKPMTTAPSLKSSLSLALFINLSVYSHGLGSGLEDTFADIWSHHTGLIFLAVSQNSGDTSLFTLCHLHDNGLEFSFCHLLNPSVLWERRIISSCCLTFTLSCIFI